MVSSRPRILGKGRDSQDISSISVSKLKKKKKKKVFFFFKIQSLNNTK